MKKQVIFFLFVFGIILTSCDDANITSGSYTYKLSGNVTLRHSNSRNEISLADEIGQLDVVKTQKDSVLVIMNQINGNVMKTAAYIKNDSLFLVPFQRKLSFTSTDSDTISTDFLEDWINIGDQAIETTRIRQFNIKVSGTGIRYNDLIVFTLSYDGQSQEGNIYASGNNITMVAKRN